MGKDAVDDPMFFTCVALSLGLPAPLPAPPQILQKQPGGTIPIRNTSWGPGGFSKEGVPPCPILLARCTSGQPG